MYDDTARVQEPSLAAAITANPSIQPAASVTPTAKPPKQPKARNKPPEREREEIDHIYPDKLHGLLERKLKEGGIMGLSGFVMDKTLLTMGEVLIRLRLKLKAEYERAARHSNGIEEYVPKTATLQILPLIEHYGVFYAKLLRAITSAQHTASLGRGKPESEEDAAT
ncbi:MAG: hypothetical protein NTY53_23730 [Kiritimatiellaeota bacterium]|nr:hypothetical protein [Kiritimatiellota bacterium]